MRKQTQFARQRFLQQQAAQFLNDSELPFTVPLCLPIVDSDPFVARTAACDPVTTPRKV